MIITNLDLLLRLIIAHFIADFLFQPSSWIQDKKENKIKSKFLYYHILIVGIISYMALGRLDLFWVVLIIVISHFFIDLIKLYNKPDKLSTFIVDQLLHVVIIIYCWLIYSNQFDILWKEIIFKWNDSNFLLIIIGYLFLSIPTSTMIRFSINKWVPKNNDESLKNAGKLIGIIERFLVLTFILLNQYEAIGFLLAAKSVFRFGELRNGNELQRTEYVLIGTLISFSISIFLGILIRFLSQIHLRP